MSHFSLVKINVGIVRSEGRFLFAYDSESGWVRKDGTIEVPYRNGPVTLQFQLKTANVELTLGKVKHTLPISFGLGDRTTGRHALRIWRPDDDGYAFPTSVFSSPALSGGKRGRPPTVGTTDENKVPAEYCYCLAFGVHLPDGEVLVKYDDPRIKNGGNV